MFDSQVDNMAKAAQSCASITSTFETFDCSIVVGSIIEDVMTDLVEFNTIFLQYIADTGGDIYAFMMFFNLSYF